MCIRDRDGKYRITLTDKNGVLSDYSFTSSDANVSVSKDGNKPVSYTHLDVYKRQISSAFEKLAEIFEYQVFELCIGEDYLIPYMMNDAVENYLI